MIEFNVISDGDERRESKVISYMKQHKMRFITTKDAKKILGSTLRTAHRLLDRSNKFKKLDFGRWELK